jgi:hypothetical protein
MFETPRPIPARRGPALGAAALVLLALPIYLVTGIGLRPWLLGAVLWLAGEAIALLLTRLPLGLSNLAASGAVGVGLIFRQLVAVIALFAVAATGDARLALGAAAVYVLAYTAELGLSLASYFGSEA